MSLIEKIARDIADALGDNFDYAFNSKPEWTAARGETKAGYRDVNQPFKPDYLDAAQAALTAIMDAGDGVQEVDRDAAAKFVEDKGWLCEEEWRDIPPLDQDSIAQAFARHRSTAAAAERARRDVEIVAWLREKAVYPGNVRLIHDLADAIEQGRV